MSLPKGITTDAMEWNSIPASSVCATSTLTENNIISTTSIATLTLSAIVVNGPDARNSLTTAMADAGERAINTVLVRRHL